MRRLLVAALFTVLAGCQSTALKPTGELVMVTTRDRVEVRAPGCDDAKCPLVNIDIERFVGFPDVDARVEQALLKQAYVAPGQMPPATLTDYESQFLAEAKPGWSSYLQSKVLAQYDDLAVIELTSYNFTGGANGEAGLAYLHYDRKSQRWLSLSDFLVPGEEVAFWQQVEVAYHNWLVANQLDHDQSFQTTWPFSQTDNVAFLRSQVMLRYPVGQLGPNSMGHVRLLISYDKLHGIVKPQFIPKAR